MKIALVGASGFIGKYLIEQLVKEKNISIIATFNNEKKLLKKKNLKWKKLDLEKNKKNFYKFLEYPDTLINLSWKDLPNYNSKSNYASLKYHKMFIKNLVKNGLRNLVYLGTCFEYGAKSGKYTETNKLNPVTKYAKAKVDLFKYVKKLQTQNEINFTWLRLFYIYGYNLKRDTLYNLLVKYKKKKIKHMSVTGYLKRDYLSVENVAKYIKIISMKMKNFGAVNICSGKAISLKKFARKIVTSRKLYQKINFIDNKNNSYEADIIFGCNKKMKKILKNSLHSNNL